LLYLVLFFAFFFLTMLHVFGYYTFDEIFVYTFVFLCHLGFYFLFFFESHILFHYVVVFLLFLIFLVLIVDFLVEKIKQYPLLV
jgi:hypothetical protein